MIIFLDTSSLFKLYHFEEGTKELDKFFKTNVIEEIILSELSIIEFYSVVYRKWRMKEISSKQLELLIGGFEKDKSKFQFETINSYIIESAKELIHKFGKKGLKSLDSIQLASILSVQEQIDVAVTHDELLNKFLQENEIRTFL